MLTRRAFATLAAGAENAPCRVGGCSFFGTAANLYLCSVHARGETQSSVFRKLDSLVRAALHVYSPVYKRASPDDERELFFLVSHARSFLEAALIVGTWAHNKCLPQLLYSVRVVKRVLDDVRRLNFGDDGSFEIFCSFLLAHCYDTHKLTPDIIEQVHNVSYCYYGQPCSAYADARTVHDYLKRFTLLREQYARRLHEHE